MSNDGISLLEKQQYLKDQIRKNLEGLIEKVLDEHDIYKLICAIQVVCDDNANRFMDSHKNDLGWADASSAFNDLLSAFDIILESELEPKMTRFNN